MRVFLTGATGYVGGAVADALREHGHDVTALVRPDSETRALRDRGVVLIAGDINSLDDVPLDEYDAVVHTAASSKDQIANDRKAIEALIASGAFILYTSGVWVLGNGRADEESKVNPLPLVAWRPEHEKLVLSTARGAVIRPGCVYGGKQSLLRPWFIAAEQKQPMKIVGDGNNHWAMINRAELADCYARIVDQRATGIFHAIDDGHASLNECAASLGSGKIEHVPGDGGAFAQALTVDQMISSNRTRRRLDWKPVRTFVNSIDEQWREWRSWEALNKSRASR